MTNKDFYRVPVDVYGNFELGGRAGFFFPVPVYGPYRAFVFAGGRRRCGDCTISISSTFTSGRGF